VSVQFANTADRLPLTPEGNGFFSGHAVGIGAGVCYGYCLDDDRRIYPDPASRFQPKGVHAESEVIDPNTYKWHDGDWAGLELPGQVIYEVHIGCFTQQGTWRAAETKLSWLREIGVTVIELMPVAEFHGDFGWGYDGVYWFAPTHNYGTPDELRHFVDTAHQMGLAVILDVVYNHFGPIGNYTGEFSPYFVSKRHPTEWGDAINYDGQGAETVRDFVLENVRYWIREYHLDGMRLDATQSIFDDSPRHILADLSVAARSAAKTVTGDPRNIIIVAENETQDVRHVGHVEKGGFGLDALWNDDFHHTCRVAATGHAEYYYSDFAGSSQEMVATTQYGYLFQGQYSQAQKKHRGTPTWQIPGWRFISFLQNHDQIANSAHGDRLPKLTSPGTYRALTCFWLLGPATPMFFMGQEFGSEVPFRYFADSDAELGPLVRQGRWQALRQFPRIAGGFGNAVDLADPSERATFSACKLDWSVCDIRLPYVQLHRDLLYLRRADPTFSQQDRGMIHGAILNPDCFILRWHNPRNAELDRLMIVNLGRDLHGCPSAEPLLAHPPGNEWSIMFSSEDPQYGGSGTAPLMSTYWQMPGHTAIVLAPASNSQPSHIRDQVDDL
jgi:maltooligosyltrehalose trehalohydrolase